MSQKQLEVELPEEVRSGFGCNEAEVSSRVREALVLELVRLDRISETQAADFLRFDRWKLPETMGRYQVPAIRMEPDELKQELVTKMKPGDHA